MTKKDARIIKDANENDTPIFVFTAKDKFAVNILNFYLDKCDIEGCEKAHVNNVATRLNEFQDWQRANPDKVKIPD